MFPLSALFAATFLGLAAGAPAPLFSTNITPRVADPTASAINCTQHWSPDFYQVFADFPDHNVSVLHDRNPQRFYMVQGDGGKDTRGTVLVFPSVPAGATDCTLGWGQSILGRNLANHGAASVLRTWPLKLGGKKLSELMDTVTLRNVAPLMGVSAGSADFGSWGDIAKTATHFAAPAECAGEMAFVLAFDDAKNEGMITFIQDALAGSGWYLTYKSPC